jgi:hypothetical protein
MSLLHNITNAYIGERRQGGKRKQEQRKVISISAYYGDDVMECIAIFIVTFL